MKPENPDIWAIKNPKRDKHASWVGDGLNTVREVEVRHTANLKSREP
jgi:hypothetical protein